MTQHLSQQQQRMKRKKPIRNPLVRGILAFCKKSGIPILDSTCCSDTETELHTATANIRDSTLSEQQTASPAETSDSSPLPSLSLSPSDIPKRYTSYPPLLLLPHNFPTHNQRWTEVYSTLSEGDKTILFQCIAEIGFGAGNQKIDRIAINAPIAAAQDETIDHDTHGPLGPDVDDTERTSKHQQQKKENVMRSPSGLLPVYGGWGHTLDSGASSNPTSRDFSAAFWTSTVQHKGITQYWAPLYTMFSRGNTSEKARILGIPTGTGSSGGGGEHDNDTCSGRDNVTFPGLTTDASQHQKMDVIDFYVGIGYFAFCYLTRGVRRVYGWDINPWSIEGLRRGCEANGWSCLVIRVDENGSMVNQTPADVARSIGRDEADDGNGHDHDRGRQPKIRCVAFLGDNKWTDKVMGEIQKAGVALDIRHANLGLLPTSRGSWENAVKAICGRHDTNGEGWLHIHENVDVRDIEKKKTEITHDIASLVKRQFSAQESDMAWSVSCDHVEQVKTYAPGVMHCVYDVHIIQTNPNG
ncbi:S-adenosylmethionine-dependent methyltransferase [Knufia peltigerae]|uniref:tRNA(Phe) (4-demethylwyosine(37)-C(7)) aminocarboxypropyltransferase n=1 Tax=Knufia peltigerae TaxID=1002370 RepID=A0AA38XZY9_9EURO|nr:S-adenosylmethionine-dependent methyltransferase [Knufia peltigerae]